jgi:SAM-dependent methyltransferase
MHNYVVLNYEKFQQRNRSELVRDLIDLGLVSMEREQLRVPLPLDVRKKVEVRRGGFATINHRWSTSNSGTVFRRLQEEPEEWHLYHTLYREARVGWDEIPAERIAGQLSNRPDWRVGDFGCGECLLKDYLPDHNVVSLDYVALDEDVIAGDMAHTPLEVESLDVVVFSLSLMGHNWQEYLTEAHRVLWPFGLLFIAETARKWEKGELEQALTKGFGISTTEQRGDFHYVVAMKKG